MSDYSYLNSNPLHNNPLKSRSDMQRAMVDVFNPLLPYFSPGKAGVRLGASGTHYKNTGAELEGLLRPVWGLAPLAAGGGQFRHWDIIRQGLISGTTPDHNEFWNDAVNFDQMIVESAALGFSLALVPEKVWDPLSSQEKQNLGQWLESVILRETHPNNWHFFPAMVALGLENVGWKVDWSKLEHRFEAIETYYIDDGWYRDGRGRRLDHYIGFAIHFYSLIYSKLRKGDEERCEIYRQRAVKFARHFRHWFASDGAGLAFGRSMTYRFAQASFWSGLAFAGVEALPWGEIKGLALSNIRWWSNQPIADRDGVLSIGYAYPNLLMSEIYNSPGSPYWATKAFVPLALSSSHPFWQAQEVAPSVHSGVIKQKQPGMLIYGESKNITVLSSGQETLKFRHDGEKYAKFAYSTRYGFSVESDDRVFANNGAFDNMLALSEDGHHYRVRTANVDARIGDNVLYSKWLAWPDVQIETWLIVQLPWHLRIHRIVSSRALQTIEGGFALDRTEKQLVKVTKSSGKSCVQTTTDFSGIRLLGGSMERQGRAALPAPNTSLMFPRSIVPQLIAGIEAGETIFGAAILASPNIENALRSWDKPPEQPNLESLNKLRDAAEPVSGWAAEIEPGSL